MRNIYAILIIITALLTACSESSDNATDALHNDISDNEQLATNTGDQLQSGQGNAENVVDTSAENSQGNGTSTTNTASPDLRNVYNTILTSLAGYDLELIGEQIALLADNATVSALSSSTLPGHTVDLEMQGTVQPYPVTSTQYACAMGGTLVVDTLDVDTFISDYSSEIDTLTYRFEQCQLNADNTQVFNGVMAIGTRYDSGRRHSTSESTYQWQNFQWQQENGTLVTITADITINSVSSYDNYDSRQVSITEHTSTDANGVVSGVKEGSFSLTNASLGSGAIYEYTLQTSGHIIDASELTIDVTTDPAFYRKYVVPAFTGEQSIPFSGQINLSASDGSALSLMAVDPENTGTRLVDIVHTSGEGYVSTLQAQELTHLEVYAP